MNRNALLLTVVTLHKILSFFNYLNILSSIFLLLAGIKETVTKIFTQKITELDNDI